MAVVGCTDLDTVPEGSTITSEQKAEIVEADPSKSEAGVNAIFSTFSQYMPNSGAIGANRHNDFGYPSVMLFTDANGFDVVSQDNGYNWTASDLDFSDRTNTTNECQILWNDMYSIVYACNSVIGNIDAATEDAQSQYFLAQGLATRAFAYLIMAQLYQYNYEGHETSPCVPLITDENANDCATNGSKRATVSEVYTQIATDVNQAIDLLTASSEAGISRPDKRYIDLATAYGIRARMNLAMHKYADAAADADAAIKASPAQPASIAEVSVPTFWSSTENCWMWGIIVAETDDVVSSGIVNWPSHRGSLNYGYAAYSGGFAVNQKLYASIPETDARKGWWLDENGESVNLNAEQQAYIEEQGFGPYVQVKFAPYKNVTGTSINANDVPLMRIEEMYLIKAEGLAMSGGDGASVLADFVRTYRDPSYVCTLTGSNLQTEILRQRRIELWGEGLSWYDIMRLGLDVDRRGAGYQASMVFNIAANDPIMLWQIPEAEIEANPALETSDNNPVGTTPQPVKE